MNNTVMLIEDNARTREALAALLILQGHQVVAAANGRQGLALLHARPLPALIILDLMMPVMNGWTFLEHKEADPELAAIPVIVSSAVAEVYPPRHSRSVVASVGKLVDVQPLLALVRRTLMELEPGKWSSPPGGLPGSTASSGEDRSWCTSMMR